MSNFQTILLGVFIFFIVIGVAVFATLKNSSSNEPVGIVLWGTVSSEAFGQFVNKLNLGLEKQLKITYIEKRPNTFDQEYIEALAKGGGPDAILLSQDLILRHRDTIIPVPYSTFPERDFKDVFIAEGELYLSPAGILAFPFSIDPLVMYWNRDSFTNAGLATYPRTWTDMGTLTSILTTRDVASNVRTSAVALGEFRNINHAKEILSALIIQAGNPITTFDAEGKVQNLFADRLNFATAPTETALSFYTKFSNPVDPLYSWNRALPASKTYFLSGNLATYFGFASELSDIRTKNPNLNFDVAVLPQALSGKNRATFGNMLGLAISKSSQNPSNTFVVLSSLFNANAISIWSESTKLPPVRRDLLLTRPQDPYLSVFYDSALISKAWLDPRPESTDIILRDMVESVTSGKSRAGEAVSTAGIQIDNLLQ
ncbi:extracellular solute-binding protein [Patescibacteria group bacterium]|nr:MAG: extracellular solute-binding protein [Patescibacteria group bacterium]